MVRDKEKCLKKWYLDKIFINLRTLKRYKKSFLIRIQGIPGIKDFGRVWFKIRTKTLSWAFRGSNKARKCHLNSVFFPSNFAETVFAPFFPNWTIEAVVCKDGFHLDLLFVYTDLQLSTSICGEYNKGIVGQDLKFCKTMKIILFTGKLKKGWVAGSSPRLLVAPGRTKLYPSLQGLNSLNICVLSLLRLGPLSNIIPIFCLTFQFFLNSNEITWRWNHFRFLEFTSLVE